MLTSLIMVIISQCIHISKHQAVQLEYIQFLSVNYTPVKLGEPKTVLKEKSQIPL